MQGQIVCDTDVGPRIGSCEVLVTICQSQARDNPLGVGTIPRDPNVHISGGTGLSVNRNSETPMRRYLTWCALGNFKNPEKS